MKRTTIMIPDELKMRAIKYASRMGMSLGGFIRESLERALEHPDGGQSSDTTDPLLADDAVFSGKTPEDLAENHDDYLYGDSMSAFQVFVKVLLFFLTLSAPEVSSGRVPQIPHFLGFGGGQGGG